MALAPDSASAREHAIELYLSGRLAEAETILARLLREDPTSTRTAGNLGLVLLSQGRYREGASLYESRLYSDTAPPDPRLPYPRWDGEPLAGKNVLVWPEQGLGDQIMFARFAASLKEIGCDVTLVCSPALERLFASSLPVRVLGARGSISFPDPDIWLWSSSLLAAAGGTVPSSPYLQAEPRPTHYRIGVCAGGNPAHKYDAHRSLPPDIAPELWSLPGAKSLALEHLGTADMFETAQIVASLDLVISVDTSVAHLAAALGKPTWILLSAYATDWRWSRSGETTPWYPSARLFRQPEIADWASVLRSVRSALASGVGDDHDCGDRSATGSRGGSAAAAAAVGRTWRSGTTQSTIPASAPPDR